ncbi:glutamate receptor 2.7-like [Cynara cardunculus var. scolymus]|uniref:glutamate receptor 2.7-like n=1 Tax=Cynara cardunculus var. scolymus TaxID=59895 RepID=UPI000D62ED68|nr:glutamate receptor 2.7-like [Cynara cardunculus var. scolymus]
MSYSKFLFLFFFLVSVTLPHVSVTVAQTRTTNVGVIIDERFRAGKEQKTAIKIAVQKLNSGSKDHKLAVYFKNSSGDPLQVAASANELINTQNVRVIIGTDSWEEASILAKIGERARIPVISWTAASLQPLSRLQWPFLVQMTDLDMSDEIKCITTIVQSYNWKRVIVIYEDNVYGGEYRALSLLSESLEMVNSGIEHRLVVPHFTSPFDPKETIRDRLVNILKEKQSRVFIVLRSSLPTTIRVFEEANKLGLIGRDSVWILGDTFSSFLDSIDPSAFRLVQGALGLKTYYSDNNTRFLDFKSNFKTVFRSNYPEEDKFEPGIHAIRAYDSVEMISQALDRLRNLDDTNHDFPEKLLDTILSSNFSGLTSTIAFQNGKLSGPRVFRLVNIIGKSYQELGFLSPESGFSNNLGSVGHHGLIRQLTVHWPGDLVTRTPKGWAMPNDNNKMTIGVPNGTSFDRFVKVEWIQSSNETRYSGLCIDVFELVVATLEVEYGYTLSYEFVNHTGSYNDMVDKVYYKNYDAVVGDVTILANRSKYVEFTQPFTESGLSMVVPVKSEPYMAWKFMRPFTVEMWLATFGILFYTMFVVWFMEHQVNQEFRGPWKEQLGTALWFTFNSLFFSHREKIQSNHSKVVVMIWLFVVFILTSSYTASLTSMLTVRVLEPTVRDIEWLRKNNASVGCDPDSFVSEYLMDVLNLKNIMNVSTQDQYPEYFKNGSISAAFLELPYQKYFLEEYCNKYTAVAPSYKFGGLGFVFPKDSPITDDVSEAILMLLQDGQIRELENKWLNTSQNSSRCIPKVESQRLSLANFWGIFLISGLTSTLSLVIFLYRLLHNQIEQRIISFNGSHWGNENRWRKALRLIQIVLYLNPNRIQPPESSNSVEVWNHRNPPRWELVSPTEVPEHLEIGRPTQLEIPMRKMDHTG